MEVLVGVRIVKCHAIVDVLCHAVMLRRHWCSRSAFALTYCCPLCVPNSHTVLVHPTLSRSHSFEMFFHCILTALEVWYLQTVIALRVASR